MRGFWAHYRDGVMTGVEVDSRMVDGEPKMSREKVALVDDARVLPTTSFLI